MEGAVFVVVLGQRAVAVKMSLQSREVVCSQQHGGDGGWQQHRQQMLMILEGSKI